MPGRLLGGSIVTAAPMDCKDLVELVTAYLEGALDESARASFDAHLTSCEGCATYLDQIRATVRMLGSMPDETWDPVIQDRLLAAFQGWHGS